MDQPIEADVNEAAPSLFARLGIAAMGNVMLALETFRDRDTDLAARLTIAGALSYLLCPLDLVPDVTPFVGFADDMSALTACIAVVSSRITPAIRARAEARVRQLGAWMAR